MRYALLLTLGLTGCATAPMPVVQVRTAAVKAAPINWPALPDWDISVRENAGDQLEPMVRLAQANPNSAITQRRLLNAAFAVEDAVATRAALERMADMGLALSSGAYAQIGKLVGEDFANGSAARTRKGSTTIAISRVVTSVPGAVPLTEGLAYDPRRGRIFAGSIVGRSVHHQVADTMWEELKLPGLGSVTALAVDPEQRLLWLSSSKVDSTPTPESAFVGLIALDLDSLTERRRIPAGPGITGVNDLAVASDGTVYVSDSLGGGVYRLRVGSDRLEVLVPKDRMASPQGIALDPRRAIAYIADFSYGIAILDLGTGQLKRLQAPDDLALDGTDGLYWHEGALIAIQNGLRPHRIVRMDLDSQGKSVFSWATIERAHPDWGEPTVGQIVGNELYYVSDPQWDRFGKGGDLRGEEPLRDNRLRAAAIGRR